MIFQIDNFLPFFQSWACKANTVARPNLVNPKKAAALPTLGLAIARVPTEDAGTATNPKGAGAGADKTIDRQTKAMQKMKTGFI